MRESSDGSPERCAECGARGTYRRRFVTGGGWRPVYVCAECGDRHRPDERRVVRLERVPPRVVAGLAAVAVGAAVWLRRRLGRE